MSKYINENTKLGEIVSIYPKASDLFNKHKIDFCCGGHDTLGKAVKEKGLDVAAFVEELNNQYEAFLARNEEFKDWRKETPTNLIDHIYQTHHVYTKNELKELDYLMFKILKVHFEHHSEVLLKLHRLFGLLKIELEEHLVKEEENLFPLILAYEETKNEKLLDEINKFIKETEDEHDAAGDILKEIEVITNDFHAPSGACNTFKLVYAKLDALEKDLFQHIYLENTVLFNML